MNRLLLLALLVMVSTSLLAQSVDSLPVKQDTNQQIAVMTYCATVETLSDVQQPRMFAQVFPGFGPSSRWAEFESKEAWRQNGAPKPLALVWYKDRNVVRVAIADGRDDGHAYSDYCYRPDGSLARIRSMPAIQTHCDNYLFHCAVTFRGERLYPAKGIHAAPLAQRGVDQYYLLFPPLRPEQTTISFVPMDSPEYLSVSDLPFNKLLRVSIK